MKRYLATGSRSPWPPATATAVVWLILDRFHVPGWAWGVFWTLTALIWIASIFVLGMAIHDKKLIAVSTIDERLTALEKRP